jgi:hypothetical protein
LSLYTDESPLLMRRMVLDLVSTWRFPRDRASMVMSADWHIRSLDARGVDWRKHRVRSKKYKGTLGGLYDKVKSRL